MAREGQVRMSESDRAHGVVGLFDCVFRAEDFEWYDADVQRILSARLEGLQAKLVREQAGTPSTARTETIGKLKEDIAEAQETLDKKDLRQAYYMNEWRTFQMSDHVPLWVELDVDFAEDYLSSLEAQP